MMRRSCHFLIESLSCFLDERLESPLGEWSEESRLALELLGLPVEGERAPSVEAGGAEKQ